MDFRTSSVIKSMILVKTFYKVFFCLFVCFFFTKACENYTHFALELKEDIVLFMIL